MTALSTTQARALGVRIPRRKATGLPRPMNREEAAFAARLATDPLVTFWAFEGVKLRLADRTFYTPDFVVARTAFTAEDAENAEKDNSGGGIHPPDPLACSAISAPSAVNTFLELVEVKALWRGKGGGPGRVGWREDSRVKWKCAAEMYPCFRFVAAWREEGEWRFEVYGEGSDH